MDTNMKLLITGNPEFGLARALHEIYPDADFISRKTGHDLCKKEHRRWVAVECIGYDVLINNSALHEFNQTLLLEEVYTAALKYSHNLHIINIGSTTDKTNSSRVWMYNAEKKALRDVNNTMGLAANWRKDEGPKVTYISFGTLSNNQHKHPDRRCIDIEQAARYIKWVVDQPKYLSINELSIDRMQSDTWIS
jgi:hypothetical protein